LIDGAEALPRMVAELERAESHVHIAGWYFSPDFALERESEPVVLRNLLAELAERLDVRVLVVGRRSIAALPALARHGAEDAGAADQAHEDRVRA